MSKSWKDDPAKKRENAVRKAERGNHKKMEPYRRIHNKQSWVNQE